MKQAYEKLLSKVNMGETCVMLSNLNLNSDKSGKILSKVLLTSEDLENNSISLPKEVYEGIKRSLNTGRIQTINTEDNKTVLIEPFAPKPRLIIFGGGHIAKPLSEFAARVGFSVTIVDDRPFFANTERFPEAERVICESFEKAFSIVDFRKSDYVAVVTRGHRYDGIVLREVLKHELSYIGMIGSKRRVNGMMMELLEEGFLREKLALVNAPIGLDIGAVSPDEIAISIIAQLINYKNKVRANNTAKEFITPEFDIEVIEKIIEKSEMPKALITILSSKGSVPRKAGAKMIAYLDGRTIGSIGGGCSEAEVIRKARVIINDKGFIIENVDMTGDVAESDGMVCGGIMEVLVEVF